MLFDDNRYLGLIDGSERLLAKVLGLVLLVVMAVATVQLVVQVGWSFTVPNTPWLGDKLTRVLGDLLNLLIAVEVLQNITSYLRRHVVQIELVLITAMTAVARKVIVLPPGAESAPEESQPNGSWRRIRSLDPVAAARADQQLIAPAQGSRGVFIGKAQQRTALQQRHPFVLALVVPEPRRAAGPIGVNALQSPAGHLQQHFGVLLAGSW